MTKSISSSKKIFVDKNKRRKSLIQKTKIDENEHASTSYHIVNIYQLRHWVETNLNVVEFMLWNFRKKISNSMTSITNCLKRKQDWKLNIKEWKSKSKSSKSKKNQKNMNNLSRVKCLLIQYEIRQSRSMFSWRQSSWRQKSYSTHQFSSMKRTRILKIDCRRWEISWRKISFNIWLRHRKNCMYVLESMKMRWSICLFVSRRTRSSHFWLRKKFSMI